MSTDARATLPFSAPLDEAARLSGLSKSTLYELMSVGKIEGRKYGRKTLILMDGVRRYVNALPRAAISGRGRETQVRCSHPSVCQTALPQAPEED